MKLSVRLDGQERELGLGQTLSSPPSCVYREAPVEFLSSLVHKVQNGDNWRELILSDVKPANSWLAKIILHKNRNLFLSLLEKEVCEGALGLDVGAGWGQHTVEISRISHVCSVEPSPERFEFMRAICEQEGRADKCFFVNSSLDQILFNPIFDFAVCIGVLEWIGKFEECASPWEAQLRFLKRLKASLKEDAPLVVGIENRIGLKYLLGSKDDHIGRSHIACLEYEAANELWKGLGNDSLKVATYTLGEYQVLFREAGFSDLTFFSAMPDYKIPERIIECYPNDKLSKCLADGEFFEEHDGSNGQDSGFNPVLRSLYKTLGKEGIAPLFSPSYFVVAR